MKTEVKKFKAYVDKRGSLIPIEFKDLPFVPKRLFYVINAPFGCLRGCHSHYKTEQILICIKGKIAVDLGIKGPFEEDFFILTENEYIYVGKRVWDAQSFLTGEDILLVLCSTNYDKNDYVSDSN